MVKRNRAAESRNQKPDTRNPNSNPNPNLLASCLITFSCDVDLNAPHQYYMYCYIVIVASSLSLLGRASCGFRSWKKSIKKNDSRSKKVNWKGDPRPLNAHWSSWSRTTKASHCCDFHKGINWLCSEHRRNKCRRNDYQMTFGLIRLMSINKPSNYYHSNGWDIIKIGMKW